MADTELRDDRIEVLPAAVADGIAAGEVVDRPAAVVKELVENAIDAGARRIEVRVKEAGQGLIEVVDDGRGMRADDLPLAFRRHATSKIRSLEDMRAVRTLGFRGEALASIAAVARVEATSRMADGGGDGYRIVIEAGEVTAAGGHGCPAGTRVSVTRLFFNTPARLKFLKQPATENAVIVRMVTELALANPAIAIRLEVDGRRVVETHGEGDLRTTFAALHDPTMAQAMLAVDEPPVHGLISPPALHRPTRDHVIILVNGRRIHHRNLAFALEQAYRGLREPDRFPLAVLDLRIDPSEVDVNVHPTKREVRFRNEGTVFAAIERASYHALRQSPLYELSSGGAEPVLELRETATLSWPVTRAAERAEFVPADEAQAGKLPPLRYVGQLLNGYLVAEAPGAAVLIDQHAAHERVLYDRILLRLEERRPQSQMFLIPHVVDLSAPQAAAFEQNYEWLRSLGFEGTEFGPESVRLAAAPAELPESRINLVLGRVLDDLAADRTPDRRLRETAALIACHGAVRFGDPLEVEAARQLLSSLAETAEPISCPHGRPTTLVLPDQQLRRLFKRP
ncbi:MAG: DNA mismatch repair endonuclease MutL [Candidatus Dormibacteria bacterium]